jgi:hypothetical protein
MPKITKEDDIRITGTDRKPGVKPKKLVKAKKLYREHSVDLRDLDKTVERIKKEHNGG